MSYLQHLSVSTSPPEISGPCIFCQKEYCISFPTTEDMHNGLTLYFIHNERMQDSFPQLTDDQREFMISGVCPDCWKTNIDKPDEPDESNDLLSESEIHLLEDTLRLVDDPDTLFEVDDFADMDDFEEDDFFLPTEFPPTNED